MKELYLEFTFWLGAVLIIGLAIIALFKILAYLIDRTATNIRLLWNFYEFMIYRKDFDIVNPVLTYYRKPTLIQIEGCVNPYTGQVSTTNVNSEFKDDLVEVILDDTAALIAGDIENTYQQQRGTQAAERNN